MGITGVQSGLTNSVPEMFLMSKRGRSSQGSYATPIDASFALASVCACRRKMSLACVSNHPHHCEDAASTYSASSSLMTISFSFSPFPFNMSSTAMSNGSTAAPAPLTRIGCRSLRLFWTRMASASRFSDMWLCPTLFASSSATVCLRHAISLRSMSRLDCIA